MELVLLKIGSAEWEYAWEWLANHPINEGLEDPSTVLNNGCAWEYMGSFLQKNEIVHTFRHKDHPKSKHVLKLNVKGSETFTLDQIDKEFKI